MTSKFNVSMLLTVVALFVATPTSVFAVTSSTTQAQIKKYFTQLKKLPTAGASGSQVSKLVTKLSTLDPKKAKKYYALGLTKLSNASGVASGNATKIAAQVAKILKKSGLSSSLIAKITKQVTNADLAYVPPPDPNTPPS